MASFMRDLAVPLFTTVEYAELKGWRSYVPYKCCPLRFYSKSRNRRVSFSSNIKTFLHKKKSYPKLTRGTFFAFSFSFSIVVQALSGSEQGMTWSLTCQSNILRQRSPKEARYLIALQQIHFSIILSLFHHD